MIMIYGSVTIVRNGSVTIMKGLVELALQYNEQSRSWFSNYNEESRSKGVSNYTEGMAQ
jgi:hypothetical protein